MSAPREAALNAALTRGDRLAGYVTYYVAGHRSAASVADVVRFLSWSERFLGVTLVRSATTGGISRSEWRIDGSAHRTRVVTRHWRDGLVVRERSEDRGRPERPLHQTKGSSQYA